jgi:hypothetical protein
MKFPKLLAMTFDGSSTRSSSTERFIQARRRAMRQQLSARISGKDNSMMPFDALRAHLRQQNPLYQGVQEVSLVQVVGSVGRYKEFTRQFLPLEDSIKERWIGVDTLARTRGWPPIELYQVGDAYFVVDGNHRLSVANQLEMPTVEAHVWAFPETVQIEADDSIDDVIIQLEAQRFMERTNLDDRFPHHQIEFTTPHRYGELLTQIVDLQQTLSLIDQQEMAFPDAVDHWYEMIYLPTTQIIQESALLDAFPGRTEADLFVWLSKHREGLREEYGDYQNLAELAEKLVEIYREPGVAKLGRQVRRLFGSSELPPLAETAVK